MRGKGERCAEQNIRQQRITDRQQNLIEGHLTVADGGHQIDAAYPRKKRHQQFENRFLQIGVFRRLRRQRKMREINGGDPHRKAKQQETKRDKNGNGFSVPLYQRKRLLRLKKDHKPQLQIVQSATPSQFC